MGRISKSKGKRAVETFDQEERQEESSVPPALPGVIIDPAAADKFPEPGTIKDFKSPPVSKSTGRNIDGTVIPHVRDEVIASKIAKWVALGASENEIANYLNIRPGVLRREYKFEMENGKFENDMAVGTTILDMAKTGESERMVVLYARARMGWRESDALDQNNAALLNIHIHN